MADMYWGKWEADAAGCPGKRPSEGALARHGMETGSARQMFTIAARPDGTEFSPERGLADAENGGAPRLIVIA